jgi:hypothetical protein
MTTSSQVGPAGCPELRAAVAAAKRRRDDAILANTQADIESRPWPTTAADLVAARLAVEAAALEATRAGCDIHDMVGPQAGQRA